MDLFSLKLFIDTARESSFVKAAKLNFRTQSAVSFHIKNLEEELGARLFHRTTRSVALTREGTLLLEHAEEILRRCENLKTLIMHYKHAPKGQVRIGTIYSVGMYELTPILKKFIRSYPQINVHLQYLRSSAIYGLVAENKIDLGIVAYPEESLKISITPFGSDRMVLIVHPCHRLAKKHSVNLKEIEGENFISFDQGIPTGEMLKKELARKGIQVKEQMTNENIDTLKRTVEVGLGISIVPSKTVKEEVKKDTLKAIELRDAGFVRPLGILTARGSALTYPAELFLQALTKNGAGLASLQSSHVI